MCVHVIIEQREFQSVTLDIYLNDIFTKAKSFNKLVTIKMLKIPVVLPVESIFSCTTKIQRYCTLLTAFYLALRPESVNVTVWWETRREGQCLWPGMVSLGSQTDNVAIKGNTLVLYVFTVLLQFIQSVNKANISNYTSKNIYNEKIGKQCKDFPCDCTNSRHGYSISESKNVQMFCPLSFVVSSRVCKTSLVTNERIQNVVVVMFFFPRSVKLT